MRIAERIFRRVKLTASRIVTPPGERRISHEKLDGFEMLVLSNEDVGRQIALFGGYEEDETQFFKRNIKATDICIDVGGNVGFFSLLFANLAPAGEVHVFEPIRVNASLIRTNAALNAISNITVNECAVGAHQGQVTFTVSKDSAYSSIKDTGRLPMAEVVEVPITTIDAYVNLNSLPRVDVLKIDVEGAEEMVINGAANLLSDPKRRPRVILLELFDRNLKAFDTSVETIMTKMKTIGYHASVVRSGGDELISHDKKKHPHHYNVIFTVDEGAVR